MLNFPLNYVSMSLASISTGKLDPENMGLAAGISRIGGIQAELFRIVRKLPVFGRHVEFPAELLHYESRKYLHRKA